MNKPQTLLQMSSSRIPFELDSSAVVLIDFQNEYVSGKLPLYEVEAAIRETRKLLEFARKRKLPIIHVLHQGNPGSVFDVATPEGEVIAELAPKEGEEVIYKTFPNSFNGTRLETVLKAKGRNSVLIAGLMTHMCVDSSTRAAFDLGFHPAVLASTTTTRDLPGENGEAVQAATLKRATLASLQDLIAEIIPTVSDLERR